MTASTPSLPPYAAHVGVRLLCASPLRARVEQPALAELDNHVGIRHASALYAAAWAASDALVRAALAAAGTTLRPRLADSEIRYEQVPLGPITTVAEPAGGDWAAPAHAGTELRVAATSTNDHGRTVVALATTWRVGP
jgi:Domain of unknown function (DUF4442)